MQSLHTRRARAASFYVGRQLENAVRVFGLEPSWVRIQECYQAICKESLQFRPDRRPPQISRINQDSTPFQFAVTARSRDPTLQFLSEVGNASYSGRERILLSRERIAKVADVLQCQDGLAQISQLLDELAPAAEPDLLADEAGAFWIGVGFTPSQSPSMKIYVNGRWGTEERMWQNLATFVSHFQANGRWKELEGAILGHLKPLGMAITLREGEPPVGRMYFSGYGHLVSYYEHLLLTFSEEESARVLQRFAEVLLDEDCRYPTQSAVTSFGLEPGGRIDTKVELCGHCVFASDLEAAERLQRWMNLAGIDPTAYLNLLLITSNGCLGSGHPQVHSYVGAGTGTHGTYTTVYLKPSLPRS